MRKPGFRIVSVKQAFGTVACIWPPLPLRITILRVPALDRDGGYARWVTRIAVALCV